jgi:hypothetical protein
MTAAPRRVAISVTGLERARLQAPDLAADGDIVAEAEADGVTNVRLHVAVPAGVAAGSHRISITVRDLETGETATTRSAFLAGGAP